MTDRFSDLPGNELISVGVRDLRDGRRTEAALAVACAASRLRAVGVEVPDIADASRPAHELYDVISETHDGAHSRYNAVIGRVASFARAAEVASSGRR